MGCGLQVSAEVLNGKVPTLGQTGLEEALVRYPPFWELVTCHAVELSRRYPDWVCRPELLRTDDSTNQLITPHPGKCRVRLEAFGNLRQTFVSAPGIHAISSKRAETRETAAEYLFPH